MVTEEIIKKRIKEVSKIFKAMSIDGIILTSVANVSYITGFRGDSSWVLMIGKKVWLLTDSRFIEQAQNECPSCKIIEWKKSPSKSASKIISRNKSCKTIGIEVSSSVAVYNKIKKDIKIKIKKVSDVVEKVRMIKTVEEIRLIRKAIKIADDSLAVVLKKMRIGITEAELAGNLDLEMRKRFAMPAFTTIVAFGANASIAHHLPGRKKLRKKDNILIDFGADCLGYKCDKTRCFAVGTPTTLYLNAYKTVARAQAAAIKNVSGAAYIKDVDSIARQIIKDSGFPVYGHGSGHGLGLNIHEAPFMKPNAKGRFQYGQVITVEPGIYIPGKFGIRIEDDILVTDTGYKILSRGAKSPELIILSI